MQIAPTNTMTNSGTIEATNGATLNLMAPVINTGGLIQAVGAGSLVELQGSTITGGTLTTSGGGVIQNSGTVTLSGVTISGGSTMQNSGTATLSGVTLSSGITFTAVNGSSTTLMGSLTNNGTIALNSTGNYTDLILSGSIDLAGPINMSNSYINLIYGINGGTDSLTNADGQHHPRRGPRSASTREATSGSP